MDKFYKQPAETLDYDLTTDQWMAYGDYLVSATSTVSPAGLTIVSTTVVNSGTRAKVLVSGGTADITYKITTQMTTFTGLVKEKDFYIKVKDI